MSNDCRQATCCNDSLEGLTDVPLTADVIDLPVDPLCPTPSVLLSVAQVAGQWILSYATSNVGVGGSLVLVPNQNVTLSPDTTGSLVVTPVGITTYVLTATNACGNTSSATAQAVPLLPTVSLSAYEGESNCCTAPSLPPKVVCSSSNVAAGVTGTLDISDDSTNAAAFRGIYGLPRSGIATNTPVTIWFPGLVGPGVYNFIFTVTDPTGTYQGLAQLVLTQAAATKAMTYTYDCPEIVLTWDASRIIEVCADAVVQIAGPGFTGDAEVVALTGSRTIDPRTVPLECVGSGGQWFATYTLQVESGYCTQDETLSICVQPYIVAASVRGVSPDTGTTDTYGVPAGDITIDWEAWFVNPHNTGGAYESQMGVQCILPGTTEAVWLMTEITEDADGHFVGSGTVNVTQGGVLRVEPSEALCGAVACNSIDLNLRIESTVTCDDISGAPSVVQLTFPNWTEWDMTLAPLDVQVLMDGWIGGDQGEGDYDCILVDITTDLFLTTGSDYGVGGRMTRAGDGYVPENAAARLNNQSPYVPAGVLAMHFTNEGGGSCHWDIVLTKCDSSTFTWTKTGSDPYGQYTEVDPPYGWGGPTYLYIEPTV